MTLEIPSFAACSSTSMAILSTTLQPTYTFAMMIRLFLH
jgi:hypothetical protein